MLTLFTRPRPGTEVHAAAQVAPKEILFPRGGLSSATMRALAAPPFPTQLSPVNPLSEFPDPNALPRDITSLERRLGGLRLSREMQQSASSEALAALAALHAHLARMHADRELASKAQAVRRPLHCWHAGPPGWDACEQPFFEF